MYPQLLTMTEVNLQNQHIYQWHFLVSVIQNLESLHDKKKVKNYTNLDLTWMYLQPKLELNTTNIMQEEVELNIE